MSTTNRKQTQAQARKTALESDFAPLYAVAGLADSFAAQAKTSLIATRERVQTAQGELESVSKARVEEFTKLVKALPEQVKALPETVKALPETTQGQAGRGAGAVQDPATPRPPAATETSPAAASEPSTRLLVRRRCSPPGPRSRPKRSPLTSPRGSTRHSKLSRRP